MPIRLVPASLAAALLLLGSVVHAAVPAEVPVGGVLRDVPMHGLNGPDRHLDAYRGRPLLINVWASWCGPCREEMASLERLAWLAHPVPFAIIGISTDDEASAAAAFLKRTNTTLNHYLDRELQLESLLGASRLPLTIFVAADGHVLRRVYGARQWDSPAALQLVHSTFGPAHQGEK